VRFALENATNKTFSGEVCAVRLRKCDQQNIFRRSMSGSPLENVTNKTTHRKPAVGTRIAVKRHNSDA